jgi:hypothetical protein
VVESFIGLLHVKPDEGIQLFAGTSRNHITPPIETTAPEVHDIERRDRLDASKAQRTPFGVED